MIWLWFTIGFIGILLLFLLISLVCFIIVFYSKPRKKYKEGEYPLPKEKIYKPYYSQLIAWIENARKIKKDDFEITSFDGLKLRGKYYECKKGAPLEILFHGYRGDGERDVSAGIERCFALDRNVIIVDQRASGTSEGNVITFGIKERFDCVKWAEFASEKFGADTPIILSGVSMGASTVMMASKEKLPSNVKCVLADCGFTSPRDIILSDVPLHGHGYHQLHADVCLQDDRYLLGDHHSRMGLHAGSVPDEAVHGHQRSRYGA